METTRNRSAILAMCLRNALADLSPKEAIASAEVALALQENAILSIEAVAEELEEVAATPVFPAQTEEGEREPSTGTE